MIHRLTLILLLTLAAAPASAAQLITNPNADKPADTTAGVAPEAKPKLELPHPQWLREAFPQSMRGDDHMVFGVEHWQWASLFVLVLVGVSIDLLVRFLMKLFIYRVIARQKAQAKREVIVTAVRPIGLFASAVFWVMLLRANLLDFNEAELPVQVLIGAAQVFAVLTGVWATWRITDLIAEVLMSRAAKTETTFDDVLYPLLRKTVKIFIIIFGAIYGASALNIEVGPLLAGLGIGGLAFGLAARDTIENFFGSIAVVVDRPFSVGDWVVVGDTEGIVEEIGFRSTRVRTFYNSLVTVPNANLVRAVVDNYGQRKYRRWKTHVGIQYDTPPEMIVAFTEGIRELVRTHPYTRKDYFQVYLNEFADSSLNILLYIFHEVPDWSTELRERERLFLDIIRLADRLGVRFAFPTQTIHLFKEEHAPHESQHETPRSLTDRRAQVTGIRTAQELISNQRWVSGDKPGPVEFTGGPLFVEIDPATGEPLDPSYKTQIEDRTAGG